MMTLLRQLIRAAERQFRRALSWWGAELMELLPPQLMAALNTIGRPPVLLDITRAGMTVRVPSPEKTSPFVFAVNDIADVTVSLEKVRFDLERRQGGLEAGTMIRLDPQLVFVTGLDLPASAEASAGLIVEHQIERLVPLPARDVIHRHRILHRAAGAKGLKIQVIVIKRVTLERALQAAHTLGLTPKIVTCTLNSGDHVTIPFWHANRRGTDRRYRRRLDVTAACLFLAAYGLHMFQLDDIRSDLERQIAEAKHEATAAQALSRSVSQMDAALAFFERRRLEPAPMRILDDLTRTLPEDSWVSEFSLRGRAIELTGSSRDATGLIQDLEASDLFENPKFRSAITQAPNGGQRFVLSLDVKSLDPAQSTERVPGSGNLP